MLDPPIVAQNGRYVRTLTLFNQIAFDHIVGNRFYLRSELPAVPRPRPERPVIEFPMGSIAVKTAWVDVTGLPPALVARIYTRTGAREARRPAAGARTTTIGLIGLHIAQKTPSRPQWIWSSFEQKDTVPPTWADSPGAFVLNDGTRRADARSGIRSSLAPLAPEPVTPFNVVRDAGAPILTRHRADELRATSDCSPARPGSTTGSSSRSGRGSRAIRPTPIPAASGRQHAEHVSRRRAPSRRSPT